MRHEQNGYLNGLSTSWKMKSTEVLKVLLVMMVKMVLLDHKGLRENLAKR